MITTVCKISYGSQTVPPIVPAVQGDTGRAISFEIADFTPPAGATATYFILKPSGEAIYNSATITNNSILCELTAQSLAEAGENRMQVRVLQGEDIVTSFEVILMVRTFLGDDAIESGTEMNIFDQAVEQATEDFQTNAEQIVEEVIESIPADYTELTEEVDELNERIDNIEPGLSDEAKAALLNCFAHTVYTDDDADYYGILRDSLYADAFPKITAVFNPSTHQVYQGDALDSLKPYLTVKYYENSSSAGTIISETDYVLSGTLTEGTQTIYVRYTTLNTSFLVDVINPFIYRMSNTPVVLDGSTGIDTGVALLSENRSFTLAWEYADRRDYAHDSAQGYGFGCYLASSPYTGIFMQIYDGGTGSASTRRKIRHVLRCTPPGNSGGGQVIFDNDIAEEDIVGRIIRFCFRYDSTTGTVKALFSVNKGTVTRSADSILYTYTAINRNLIVGARMGSVAMANFMLAMCNDFRVYDSALTDAEMQSYIEGAL